MNFVFRDVCNYVSRDVSVIADVRVIVCVIFVVIHEFSHKSLASNFVSCNNTIVVSNALARSNRQSNSAMPKHLKGLNQCLKLEQKTQR